MPCSASCACRPFFSALKRPQCPVCYRFDQWQSPRGHQEAAQLPGLEFVVTESGVNAASCSAVFLLQLGSLGGFFPLSSII